MIGYYDATPQDIRGTIRFAAVLGLDWASFCVATALPATDLYTVAQAARLRRGRLLARATRSTAAARFPQLETETFTAEKLRAYRTKAYMKFYLRPILSSGSSRRARAATSSRRCSAAPRC